MKFIIDDGDTFEGDLEQFANCFFSNATPATIIDWCKEQGFKLRIEDCPTIDYRLAMSGGENDLAYTWKDKPHRLVYDLANMVDNLSERLEQAICDLERCVVIDQDPYLKEIIASIKAGRELGRNTSAIWQHYLEMEKK